MKSIGLILLVGLIIMNMVTYKSCTNNRNKYLSLKEEQKQILIKYDSILSLPPDTIEKPVIVVKDSIITFTKWFEKPNKEDLGINLYKDSIVNDSIDLRLKITAKSLYSVTYDYKPIYKYQEKVIKEYVPKPFEVVKEIKVPKSGLFFTAGIGISDRLSGKLGIMYLTKKETTFSFDLVRHDNKNIYFGSYGIRF